MKIMHLNKYQHEGQRLRFRVDTPHLRARQAQPACELRCPPSVWLGFWAALEVPEFWQVKDPGFWHFPFLLTPRTESLPSQVRAIGRTGEGSPVCANPPQPLSAMDLGACRGQ